MGTRNFLKINEDEAERNKGYIYMKERRLNSIATQFSCFSKCACIPMPAHDTVQWPVVLSGKTRNLLL